MSNHILEKNYRGTHLKLEIYDDGSAQLLINGLVRSEGFDGGTLRLSSVVQTDYEWHELIEGIVNFESHAITASLLASKVSLARETYRTDEE